jgi:hypothetical protein
MHDNACFFKGGNSSLRKAFGNLQVLKFAYKTNFLNASDEGATHKPYHVLELD